MKTNQSKTLLTLIIGASRALQQQSIALNEAEQIVFSPATIEISKQNSIDTKIINLIHLGTELEDIKSLLPDKYLRSIIEIESAAHDLLKALPEYDYNADKLIKRLF